MANPKEEQQIDRNAVPNPVILADDRDRAIRQYVVSMYHDLHSSIVPPEIHAAQFELKPVMFNMLQTVGQFSGLPSEDPHLHLRLFMEVSDNFKLHGVSKDALRIKLFPFSLRDKARVWLNSIPSGGITSCQQLTERFLSKYFPPTKNVKLRNEITSFQQFEEESLYEAWERYKELLRKCPHHGISYCSQMETFYNGLNAHTRMIVDASANGALLSKSYNEAFDIIKRIANNNYQWPTSRLPTGKKTVGVLELDVLTSLTAQMSSMSHMLNNMEFSQPNVQTSNVNTTQVEAISCVFCVEEHVYEHCPHNLESVNYLGNQNRGGYSSNNYNPSWKKHPNFSWSNTGAAINASMLPQKPPFQQHIFSI